jgi:hypothetical protein
VDTDRPSDAEFDAGFGEGGAFAEHGRRGDVVLCASYPLEPERNSLEDRDSSARLGSETPAVPTICLLNPRNGTVKRLMIEFEGIDGNGAHFTAGGKDPPDALLAINDLDEQNGGGGGGGGLGHVLDAQQRVHSLVAVDVRVGGTESPPSSALNGSPATPVPGAASLKRPDARRMALVLTKAHDSQLYLVDATTLLVCSCTIKATAAALQTALLQPSYVHTPPRRQRAYLLLRPHTAPSATRLFAATPLLSQRSSF